ncbi:MAG: helicase-exonuclease AddAB subunit AddA, partial [Kurthia sp.]|nr:helicase-exonuclease AddAB subunit AddA [Candidatus Kurthia equi]
RIANETEAALLRDDTMAEILEEAYAAEDKEDLYRLVDAFTSDRDDQDIEILISQLYEMSRVNPQPQKWLDSLAQQYELGDITTIDELPIADSIKKSILLSIEAAIQLIQEVRQLSLRPDGPDAFGGTAEKDLEKLMTARGIMLHHTWEEAYGYLSSFKWDRLASQKKDTCDERLKESAKAKRNQAKKILEDSLEIYFQRPPEKLLEEISTMKPFIETLVELTHTFSVRYAQAKADKGLIDFSDLEHFALEILTGDDLQPSDVAQEYRQHFEEVLVDEYQDTNRLQETILQLVKRGDAHDGNMFMVGDVKQSIYRFRLAEPTLFLNKYLQYETNPQHNGMKIDLNANFRSRHEVLDGTNYIFKQIMGETVGEIDYDEAASLKPAAPYPPHDMPISLAILHSSEPEEEEGEMDEEIEELKKSQQEARYIIAQIQHLMASEQQVYDAFKKDEDGNPLTRPLEYKDIVILMRSMTWSADFVEEFKLAGIPLYAEVSKGYFDAIEVMVMMNTLRVIDNPYQDIELVSVLRSPFIGMTENELAQIRLADTKAPFYDALKIFVKEEHALRTEVAEKLQRFLLMLEDWRDLARRGSLADLIWQVYLDTNYYEMVGAMVNGKQRQANLLALHDRAIAYEKTSFRGLFRFLRFIDRMRLRGDDLGTAKAMSQSENVVRIMTIHASKGLEFPYVFTAGLGREFNRMDFNRPYLFDSAYGLAVKMIDPEKRIQYTSLPFLAMKEKKMLEMKSEEMRVLYVAMTRAKEKLFLVGTVKDWEKTKERWEEAQFLALGDPLPEHQRAKAKSYLDWIGPAVARHSDYYATVNDIEAHAVASDASRWKFEAIDVASFSQMEAQTEEAVIATTAEENEDFAQHLHRRLDFQYPFAAAVEKPSKTSVSELKRMILLQNQEEPEFNLTPMARPAVKHAGKRPQFLQKVEMSGAEKGTAIHAVMEHIPQQGLQTVAEVEQFVDSLVQRQLITAKEGDSIDGQDILRFFDSEIGQQFAQATILKRELPFTRSVMDGQGDAQIIQGIIDCLYQKPTGEWILLDYKTDRATGSMKTPEGLKKELTKRYAIQLNTYKQAIEDIIQIKVSQSIIYAFDVHQWLEV